MTDFVKSRPFYLLYYVARELRSVSLARRLIKEGAVKVNDQVVTEPLHVLDLTQKQDVYVTLPRKLEYIQVTYEVSPSVDGQGP